MSIEHALVSGSDDARALVEEGLASGALVVINRHSVSGSGLDWLDASHSAWLGDGWTGGWVADTGFVVLASLIAEARV